MEGSKITYSAVANPISVKDSSPLEEESGANYGTVREGFSQGRPMTKLRAIMISILIGCITSSLYFAYHQPGALETALEEDYGWSSTDIGLLFTTYSTSPFFMLLVSHLFPQFSIFVGGRLITAYGLRFAGFILMSFIVVGTGMGAIATLFTSNSYKLLWIWMIARFIVGIGEAMITWQQSAITIWFSGSHFGTAMSTAITTAQVIGSALSFYILPELSSTYSLDVANWFHAFFCIFCMLLLSVYIFIENSHSWWFNRKTLSGGTEEDNERIPSFKDFPLIFWIQIFFIFFVVTVFYSSANFFPAFLIEQYGISLTEAGHYTSLFYWTMILAPFAGALTDKYGNRLNVQIISCYLGGIMFMLLYTHPHIMAPWMFMAILGICFCCVESNSYVVLAGTWTKVPGNPVGIGFACMGIALNIGLLILPISAATLIRGTGTTVYPNILFSVFMFIGAFLSLSMALTSGKHLNHKIVRI